MALSFQPFRDYDQVNKAAANSPWMKWGDNGDGVAIVQTALIDLGYRMPLTVGKGGKPDGKYGNETYAAIKKFQADQNLKGQDGTAGRETLGRLDSIMIAKGPSLQKPAPKVTPKKPIVSPGDSHYMLGTSDPHVQHDPGAGGFGSKNKTAIFQVMHAGLQVGLSPYSPTLAAVLSATGPNAVAHMRHYLDASGKTYTINLESMVRSSIHAKERYRDEVMQAIEFAEKLPAGTHNITSKTPQSENNDKDLTTDWYFATGGYACWGKGVATVADGPAGKTYELAFEYRFQDMYNWDGKKKVTLKGITITDEKMGEFHRQGLAKEFLCVGSFRRRFSWKHGETIPESQYTH